MAQNDLRVLVVDDNPINRRLLSDLLAHLGCDVSTAEDGAEALNAVSVDHFDLVCLDRNMPRLSGDEAVARLPDDQLVLAWSTETADLPARFNGALPKPVTLAAAIEAIHAAQAWRLRGAGFQAAA